MATAMARTDVEGSSLTAASGPPQSSRPAALESAVDAYATRVLRMKSPPEASVDDSLGPYVTSIIRCSLDESSASRAGPADAVDVYDMDVEELIDDFESLVELLEGHCGMTPEVAKSALHGIAIAVKTGLVDTFDDGDEHQHATALGSFRSASVLGTSLGSIMSFDGNHGCGRLGRSFRSKSVGAANDQEGMDAIQMLGDMLRDTGIEGQNQGDFGVGFGGRGDLSPSNEHHDEFEEQPSFMMDEDIASGNDDSGGLREQYHGHAPPGVSALSTPQQSSGSTSPDQVDDNTENIPIGTPAVTPMRLNRLIPEDLLGVLDDPATPAIPFEESKEGNTPAHSDIPPCPDLAASTEAHSDKISRKGKGKKKPKADAQDLAAALFRPSRARSNSVSQDKSPMLKPLSAPAPATMMALSSSVRSDLFQQQLDSATQILLSMNGSLGEEAATEAAMVSNNDINIAQYVIDGAMAAPPVCRHALQGGCYRSDCHFSHDVEGHTCLFWLRGRCGKGESCRFMHGFSEKLLEGIKKDFLPSIQNADLGEGEQPILTANLVQHNRCMSSSLPKHDGRALSFLDPSQGKDMGNFSQMSASLPKQSNILSATRPSQPTSVPVQPLSVHSPSKEGPHSENVYGPQGEAPKPSSISAWSNVAQRGYSLTSFSSHDDTEATEVPVAKGKNKHKAVKIPQNLWNPSEKRSSSAFHIADPMKRYAEVSATHPRKDVVDLHYQSMKTFSIVLSQVLPIKFRQHNELWVLTGTGHHVARNSHQKSGGVLESAVMSWLDDHGYDYMRGKDRNGYCGAVLVKHR